MAKADFAIYFYLHGGKCLAVIAHFLEFYPRDKTLLLSRTSAYCYNSAARFSPRLSSGRNLFMTLATILSRLRYLPLHGKRQIIQPKENRL